MKCIGLLIFCAGLAYGAAAQTPAPTGYTYRVDTAIPGKTVYISGQRPFNASGQLVGGNSLDAQTRQVFDNLKTELGKVGMTLDNITQVTYLLKNPLSGELSPVLADQATSVAATYLSSAITRITDVKSTAKIVSDDVLIEVEVIAVK